LTGLIFAVRRNPELTLLVVVVGVYAIGIVAFFPVARYRVPLVPLLACAAALGVREIAEAVRSSRRTRSVLTVLAVLTGAAVLVDGGWVRARWDPAVDAFTRAWTHQQRGRPAAAIAELEHALVLDPGHHEALANLAALYGMRGEPARSADTARRALALDPDRPRAWVNLANAQLMLGQPAEAESSLTRALALQPDLPEAWTAYLRLARGPESEERVLRLARTATETWPRDPTGWVRLGHLLRESGRVEEAEAALNAALRANPGSPDARAELERLRTARGPAER
jgi:tetratricopeptide (TPR) repeat protein